MRSVPGVREVVRKELVLVQRNGLQKLLRFFSSSRNLRIVRGCDGKIVSMRYVAFTVINTNDLIRTPRAQFTSGESQIAFSTLWE